MKKLAVVVSLIVTVALVAVGCGNNAANTMDDNTMTNDVVANDTMEEDMVEEETTEEESMAGGSAHDMMADEGEETEEMADDASGEMLMTNEGDPVGDYELLDLEGNYVSLADFEGEKVYVKYWASWCSVCLSGMEELEELAETEDFKVITIVAPNYNGEKSVDEFKEWFAGLGTENIEVLFDEEAAYAMEFGVFAVPTSIYIGSDGVRTSVTAGHSSNEAIFGIMETIY